MVGQICPGPPDPTFVSASLSLSQAEVQEHLRVFRDSPPGHKYGLVLAGADHFFGELFCWPDWYACHLHGLVWCGVVWCGVVWCGVVWCGVVWCGVVWCGVVWCGVVWCGVPKALLPEGNGRDVYPRVQVNGLGCVYCVRAVCKCVVAQPDQCTLAFGRHCSSDACAQSLRVLLVHCTLGAALCCSGGPVRGAVVP